MREHKSDINLYLNGQDFHDHGLQMTWIFHNNELPEFDELFQTTIVKRDDAPKGLDNLRSATLKTSFQDGQPEIVRRRTAKLRAYPVLCHRKRI